MLLYSSTHTPYCSYVQQRHCCLQLYVVAVYYYIDDIVDKINYYYLIYSSSFISSIYQYTLLLCIS